MTSALALSIFTPTPRQAGADVVGLALASLGSESITWTARLRGHVADDKLDAHKMSVGGLRGARRAVSKLHLAESFGRKLHRILWPLIVKNAHWAETLLNNLGKDDAGLDETAVEAVRQPLASATGAKSLSPADNSPILAGLLAAWQVSAADPDVSVPAWMLSGAPAGIDTDQYGCPSWNIRNWFLMC